MSGQFSLFSMDLDTAVASEPALEVGTAPEPPNDETVLLPAITVEPPAEETTQLTHEIDDQFANETISVLPHPIDLEQEEQQPATVLPALVPVIPPEQQFDLIIKAHWTNSQDLAYRMINIALPKDEQYLFDDFTTYVKACRLGDTGNGTKPKANKRFDQLAWCLHQMEFSKIEHGGKVRWFKTETYLLTCNS